MVSSRHPFVGSMKGTVRIAPGTEITAPAAPYWGLDLANFRDSVRESAPPPGISAALTALWWAAKGEWDRAHVITQDDDGADASWVHAYLHRVEGDLGNARYWYARARRAEATGPLEAEWEAMVAALLDSSK